MSGAPICELRGVQKSFDRGGGKPLRVLEDIDLTVQTKLLRVIQERTLERVGSAESIPVDVRIVTATHQNLETLIRQGR